MIQQSQFLSQPRQISSILTQSSNKKKVSVYFTYQSSAQAAIQQNLKVIKQQKEERMRKRIFSPCRKLSFQQSTNKKRQSRLRIFQQHRNRVSTINQPQLIEGKKTLNLMRFNTSDLQRSIDTNEQNILRKYTSNIAFNQYLSTACYQKSPMYLKQSIISGAETIVDQLDDLVENGQLKNPINRKLLGIKNRQMKRTFYSNTVNNTVKNSLIVGNDKGKMIKMNRIDSDVLNFHYSPNAKYRSSATIKATDRQYGTSKLSNNLSIITTGNNHNKQFYQNFKDKEDVQTPRYNKSTYRSMRKSYQPSVNDKQHIIQQQQSLRKNSLLQRKNQHIPIDRFYDQSSLQTPRLPVVTKTISYEVIDPLTNSLKKQKMQKKQLRKLSQIAQVKTFVPQSKFKQPIAIMQSVNKLVSTSMSKLSKGKESCVSFLRSELFFIIIIVILSLAIFGIQLLQ